MPTKMTRMPAMLTREVQEEEGDEADQAIPEDEQLTRSQLTTKVARTAADTRKPVAE